MISQSFNSLFLSAVFAVSYCRVGVGQAATDDTPRCVCGENADGDGDSLTDTSRSRLNAGEAEWCLEEGRALLHAVYDRVPKVPPGFRGNDLTDFEQTASVQWITRPSSPRIEGSYRMNKTLAHAADLAESRHEVTEFFERGRAMDLFIPHLAAFTIVREQESRLFFEFLSPSTIGGKTIAFRVWKTGFLVPTAGSLLADADRTGSLKVGTVPTTIDAADLSLFLEGLWWENYANTNGAKVLRLPNIQGGRHELRITMPVTFLSGGDWGLDDRVARHVWKVRVDRVTGELIRAIEPDVLCVGRHNPGGIVKP